MFISYIVTVISIGTYQYAAQIFTFHSSVMFLVRSAISLMRMKEAHAEAVKCDKSAVIWVGGLSPWLFASQFSSFALGISSQSAAKTKGGPWFPISSWESCGSSLPFWTDQHPSCFSSPWRSQLYGKLWRSKILFFLQFLPRYCFLA